MLSATSSISRLFTFVGGSIGLWNVDQIHCVAGKPLLSPSRLGVRVIQFD